MIDDDLMAVMRYMRKDTSMSKEDAEKYTATYKGRSVILSKKLVERQGVGDETLEHIKDTHIMRLKLFEQMENTDKPSELVELSHKVMNIEYLQQQLWGFEENYTYHRWFEVPKCTCPYLDNLDNMGTTHQSVSLDCPVHYSEQMRGLCRTIENGG